jgi:hypothetical protein
MGLEYKINGRKVSSEEWFRHLADEARTKATEEVEQRLARVSCPVHGKKPQVSKRQTADGFTFDLSGCCQAAIDEAQRVLQ